MFIFGFLVWVCFLSRLLWFYKLGMRPFFNELEIEHLFSRVTVSFLVGILNLILVGPFVLLMMPVWYGYLLVCILYNMCGRP